MESSNQYSPRGGNLCATRRPRLAISRVGLYRHVARPTPKRLPRPRAPQWHPMPPGEVKPQAGGWGCGVGGVRGGGVDSNKEQGCSGCTTRNESMDSSMRSNAEQCGTMQCGTMRNNTTAQPTSHAVCHTVHLPPCSLPEPERLSVACLLYASSHLVMMSSSLSC